MNGPHLCRRCQGRTYPDAWCQCDPRDQIADFLVEECVYLMPDDVEAADG